MLAHQRLCLHRLLLKLRAQLVSFLRPEQPRAIHAPLEWLALIQRGSIQLCALQGIIPQIRLNHAMCVHKDIHAPILQWTQ